MLQIIEGINLGYWAPILILVQGCTLGSGFSFLVEGLIRKTQWLSD